jgi:hypothetical protein
MEAARRRLVWLPPEIMSLQTARRCFLTMSPNVFVTTWSIKTVDIGGATVAGNVSMIGARFDGPLIAGLLKVGGNLEMGSLTAERLKDFARLVGSPPEYKASKVKFNQVLLMGSKVEGNILIPDAIFEGALDASFLKVGGNMDMHDSHYADQVEMGLAHIGGSLNLRGAGLAGLDLSGASSRPATRAPAFFGPRSAPWPAMAWAHILSKLYLGCSSSGWPAWRCFGGPFRRRRIVEQSGASAPAWRSSCPCSRSTRNSPTSLTTPNARASRVGRSLCSPPSASSAWRWERSCSSPFPG